MTDARTFLYLNSNQVAGLLPSIGEQIDMVERCYLSMAAGTVELPPKPGIHPRPNTFIHAMPAYLEDQDVAAMKWVAGYPQNKERGLPYISGLIVLNDPETGLPRALMDAAEITAARTAAASGVCIRRWAPAGWRTAAILGCGEQGRRHAGVLSWLNPEVHIQAYDLDSTRLEQMPVRVEAAPEPNAAIENAEVIITAGPILEHPDPPIQPGWLGDTYLLLPIDFDSYVQTETVTQADLFLVDDVAQFEYYRANGHFGAWPAPRASVGEGLHGNLEGDAIVCCNLGVGALDAAFAQDVFKRASASQVGICLSL